MSQDIITIGAELECGLRHTSTGRLASVLDVLGGRKVTSGVLFEEVTVDACESAWEMVTRICHNGAEITRSLEWALSQLPEGYHLVYKTRPFEEGGDGPVKIANKSRYPSMRAALEREQPGGKHGVSILDNVAPCCSLQFHTSNRHLTPQQKNLRRNMWNNSGPYARYNMIEQFRISDARHHLRIWQGTTNPRRVPSHVWFPSYEAMAAEIATIPALIVREGEDAWIPAEPGTMSCLGDADSETAIWWGVRPRSFGTDEFRFYPSVHYSKAGPLADDHLRAEYAFVEALKHERRTGWESPEDAANIFASVHAVVPHLVPEKPLTRTQWWNLYHW